MAATPRSLLGLLADSSPVLERCALFMRRFPEGRAPVFGRASSSIFPPDSTRLTLFPERFGQQHQPGQEPERLLFPERDAPPAQTLRVLAAALEDHHG
jgi:hypothetical protein